VGRGDHIDMETCRDSIYELSKKFHQSLEIIDVKEISCSIDKELSIQCREEQQQEHVYRGLIVRIRIKYLEDNREKEAIEDLLVPLITSPAIEYLRTAHRYVNQEKKPLDKLLNKFIVEVMTLKECNKPYVMFIDRTSSIGGD